MLLTFFAYGIYRELQNENYDPEVNESMSLYMMKGVILMFIWPFKVIPLGSRLATRRQQNVWYTSFSVLTILLLLIGGIGAYLAFGIFICAVTVLGYLTIVYKLQKEKERRLATPRDDENWE